MSPTSCAALQVMLTLLAGLIIAVPLPHQVIPSCPGGSRPMLRPDGEPRKCLPHQSNLCLNALEDRANVSSVCCWHNAVDYFCCTNVPSEQCPTFSNVTVVIHSGQPMGPSPLKVFTFRKNIETDFDFT